MRTGDCNTVLSLLAARATVSAAPNLQRCKPREAFTWGTRNASRNQPVVLPLGTIGVSFSRHPLRDSTTICSETKTFFLHNQGAKYNSSSNADANCDS